MSNEKTANAVVLYEAFVKRLDEEQRMDKNLAIHLFPVMLKFAMSEDGKQLLSEYSVEDIDWTQLELMCDGYICVETGD